MISSESNPVVDAFDNAERVGPRLQIQRLSDVSPTSVSWFWPQRIPAAKYSTIVGDAGLGKSWLTLDFAAKATTGVSWPDGDYVERDPVNVLIIATEDGLADTVVPRLSLAGADMDRIHAINMSVLNPGDPNESLSLDRHLHLIRQQIEDTNSSLLIIDPVSAVVGGKDSHKTTDVRQLLTPVKALAEETECTVISIMHLNKNSGESKALYRPSGSNDFVNIARTAHIVGRHPDDGNKRVFVPIKSNLSKMAQGLVFHIDNDGLHWDGTCDITADDLMDSQDTKEERGSLADAVDFLDQELSQQPVLAVEMLKRAKDLKISDRTLGRARSKFGVRATRTSEGNDGAGEWWWWHPHYKFTEHLDNPQPYQGQV